jgi:phosphoribosylformylglycinamidine cyclo-ligase
MIDSSSPQDVPPLSYRAAGVDIDAAQRLIERIKPAVSRTLRPEVLAGLGGFGALFELPIHRYQHPVLVSGTDGVGTKLKLAQQLNQHNGIGIDLVAMCVNDILVHGAEPLFFLDYFATGKLELEVATRVIEGIADGCNQAGAALVGGETAEMPGMYAAGEYDLAGFCVGIVEKDKLLDGNDIKPGDVLIGLASSGLHSNGYSLVRKVVEREALDLAQPFANSTFGEILLTPTRIYVKTLLPLIRQTAVKALAHITGGGITENLPRVLPQNFLAGIQLNRWPRPEIFDWLQRATRIDEMEMLRTFNCGLGMVMVVAPQHVDTVIQHCEQTGTQAWVIGELTLGTGNPRVVYT